MNMKKLFSRLMVTGTRLLIFSAMLAALVGNVASVSAAPSAAPVQALTGVSVGAQTGTLTYGATGSASYSVTLTRSGTTPTLFLPTVSGLPSGITGAFSGSFFFAGSSRVITLTLTKAGAAAPPAGTYTFTVTASSFFGSASGTGTLVISKANQTISFAGLSSKTFGDPDFNVTATATPSGLPVSFSAAGNCTVVGTLVHLTGAGSCTITASQAGNTNYNAATSVLRSFNIAQASQTINFAPLANKIFGDPDFNVSATATSGLVVSFSALGNCTVVGTLVHLTGSGSCTITASQAGDANYLAAPNVPQTFSIAAGVITIDLYAVTGTTTFPGLASPLTVWGYNTSNTPVTQPGGPVLGITPVINQGDSVVIVLHNNLPVGETTSLLIQGQNMIPDTVGVASGLTKSYAFTASQAGTFLYEAGLTNGAPHQVAMGLYGALIVRPSGAPSQAYASASTAFTKESVMVLSEFDPAVAADPAGFDTRNYAPRYLLINGKAYPDTGSFAVAAGDTVLLRYVNAGLQAHHMSTLGLTQTIIAQDGSPYAYSHKVVAETIATGQTLDTLVSIPAGALAGSQFSVYDANMLLRNSSGSGTGGLGGMLTMLAIPGATGSDTVGPTASLLSLSAPSPDVTVSATISDVSTGNSNITAAEFYIDSTLGSPIAMSGTFGSPTVSVSGTILAAMVQSLASGDHIIYVRGQDAAGNWGAFSTVTLTKPSSTPAGDSLYFSTLGASTLPGPVSGSASDIFFWNGTLFALDTGGPAGANVDGFDRVSATEYYMSFTGTVTLPGPLTVQKEDVVYNNAGTWSVYFDGTTNGLSASNIDAISIVGGTLYFSLSDTALPTGVTGVGDDADIYSWNGSAFARVFDATALGWSSNNVDGFVYVDVNHFYLSYSSTTTAVAGLGNVQDEDVLYYDNGVWVVYFDGTSKGLTSTNHDVDAFDLP